MTAKDLRRIRMPSSLLLRKLRPEATQRPAPAQAEQDRPVTEQARQSQSQTVQAAAALDQPRLDLENTAAQTPQQADPTLAEKSPAENQPETIKPRTPKQSLGALRTPQPLVNGVRPGTAWELPRGSQPVPVATLESLHKQDGPVEQELAEPVQPEEPAALPEPETTARTEAEPEPRTEDVPAVKPVASTAKKTTAKSSAADSVVSKETERTEPEQNVVSEKTEPEVLEAAQAKDEDQTKNDELSKAKPVGSAEPAQSTEPVQATAHTDKKPATEPAPEQPVAPAKVAEKPVEPQKELTASKVATEVHIEARQEQPAKPAPVAPRPVVQTTPPSSTPPVPASATQASSQATPAAPAPATAQELKTEPKQAAQQTVSLPKIKLPRIPKLRMPATGVSTSPLTRNIGTFAYILLALAVAQISLAANPAVGLYVNAVTFAALVLLGMRSERTRELAISAAILPLAMLVLLVLPAQTLFARTAEFMALLLVLGLTYRYLFTLDHPVAATRLRTTRYGLLFALPLMVVLGQVLGLLGYGLLHNQYGFQGTPVALVVMSAVVFAVTEEIIFRGLIQQRAMRIFHPAMAAVLSAALFALFSIGHQGGALAPLFGVVLGGVLAFIYYKKQNLLLTIAVNAAAKLTYVGLVLAFVLRG